jgi:hypothetical protein
MRRIRSPCCARAESGHAAAPPRSVMNSRRLMTGLPFRHFGHITSTATAARRPPRQTNVREPSGERASTTLHPGHDGPSPQGQRAGTEGEGAGQEDGKQTPLTALGDGVVFGVRSAAHDIPRSRRSRVCQVSPLRTTQERRVAASVLCRSNAEQ